MSDWIIAAIIGLGGVAALFGIASMYGYTPRRLAWQDLSRVERPNDYEREMLRFHIKKSMKVYLPILLGAVVVGGVMIADGTPFGVTVLICFGTPPLLAIVRAVRVLRFLGDTA
ncbi:MAG: hypothetical protein AB7P33_07560 [Dehalococcoidia bacterium]